VAYDVTNNVSTNEVDDIEDAEFEVEVDGMELDSNSNAYTDDSTHTSNDDDDAAREQEYIEMSKKVTRFITIFMH
jgi:Zn-finger nucleic acid-binding protein